MVEKLNYKVTEDKIHIEDSYLVVKREFKPILSEVKNEHPECQVTKNRTMFTLCMEWATHNMLYNLGLFTSHTKSVDLNYPQNKLCTFAYIVCGLASWIFLK